MELGRAQQRLLRGLLLRPRGLDKREILQALYADKPDQEHRVQHSMRSCYAWSVMRELRSCLEEQGMQLVIVERRQGRPVRWALGASEVPVPRVVLPHVVGAPELEAACASLGRLAGIVVRLLAAAGEEGMSADELVARLYPVPSQRPSDPRNCISAMLVNTRAVIALHGLAIVTRPRAGVTSRRYLVRTR